MQLEYYSEVPEAIKAKIVELLAPVIGGEFIPDEVNYVDGWGVTDVPVRIMDSGWAVRDNCNYVDVSVHVDIAGGDGTEYVAMLSIELGEAGEYVGHYYNNGWPKSHSE
jgi:hypothetical protein